MTDPALQKAREIVAKGYLRGWLHPPLRAAQDTTKLFNQIRNDKGKDKANEKEAVLVPSEQTSHA